MEDYRKMEHCRRLAKRVERCLEEEHHFERRVQITRVHPGKFILDIPRLEALKAKELLRARQAGVPTELDIIASTLSDNLIKPYFLAYDYREGESILYGEREGRGTAVAIFNKEKKQGRTCVRILATYYGNENDLKVTI